VTRATAARRLRVAIDVTPLLGRRTGIGHLVAGMVAALEARAASLELVRYAVTARHRATVGAVHPPLPARPAHLLWRHTGVPRVEWFTGRVDVVHGTNYAVPPARRAARVVSVHDLAALEHPEWVAAPSRRFPRLIERAVGEGAWVHCDSEHVAAKVRAWLATDRVRTVHPGIPGAPAGSSPPAPRAEPDAPPRIVFIGTVEPRKDVAGLVRAFGALDGIPHADGCELVVIGGEGWGAAADRVRTAIDALPAVLRGQVRFTGYVTDAQRLDLLRSATVLVHPALDEGFGFPPLEAMATGVPVVATRAGSLPEVLGGAALLVEPGDHHALAAAIDRVLSDHQYADHLRAEGLARAGQYSWERMAEEMEHLYREAAEARTS
jgi:glycosyltransferase involved in cell wall biosynthesis